MKLILNILKKKMKKKTWNNDSIRRKYSYAFSAGIISFKIIIPIKPIVGMPSYSRLFFKMWEEVS